MRVVSALEKASSPFYPEQPVPPEFFIGRTSEVEEIETRALAPVASGRLKQVFVQGEYGIGKTSLAKSVAVLGESKFGLHPIYCTLGGAESLNDVAFSILQATVRSGAINPGKLQKLGDAFARYVGKQQLFGFTLNLEMLKADAPKLTTPFAVLDFLQAVRSKLDVPAIVLILDEINGITRNPQFAHFLKGLVDSNATSEQAVPLLLLLCGTDEHRRELIEQHQPVERIFQIITVRPLSFEETCQFFESTFASVNVAIDPIALKSLAEYAAGYPKIMQLIGDSAFQLDDDHRIDIDDAHDAAVRAADEIGQRFVDGQIIKALRSKDYQSILQKISSLHPDEMSFNKVEIEKQLTAPERGKLNNFLQKMKTRNVLDSGNALGDYVFTQRIVRFYLWLRAQGKIPRHAQ